MFIFQVKRHQETRDDLNVRSYPCFKKQSNKSYSKILDLRESAGLVYYVEIKHNQFTVS